MGPPQDVPNKVNKSIFVPFTTTTSAHDEKAPYTAYINPNGVGSHYYGKIETKLPSSTKQYLGEKRIGRQLLFYVLANPNKPYANQDPVKIPVQSTTPSGMNILKNF